MTFRNASPDQTTQKFKKGNFGINIPNNPKSIDILSKG